MEVLAGLQLRRGEVGVVRRIRKVLRFETQRSAKRVFAANAANAAVQEVAGIELDSGLICGDVEDAARLGVFQLLSKWFSESGKLVGKMFESIQSLCEEENMLVCVLLDEVESLAGSREKCTLGNECSDSLRVTSAFHVCRGFVLSDQDRQQTSC